ncbi:MAG: hypothetical protein QW701_04535 [Candidatus Nezhaarchaeales archaeon]
MHNLEEMKSTFKSIAKKELAYSKSLGALALKLSHPVLKSPLIAIAGDSAKHDMFYKAMLKLTSMRSPLMPEEDLELITKEIEKHIKIEEEMIKVVNELMNATNDPRLKVILEPLREDEVKHHKLLLNIRDKIAKIETLTEELLWDIIWRDSPWHGAPGG